MIFTSIAAVAFAALTGMRSAGEINIAEEIIDARPDFAVEVKTMEFTNLERDIMRYEDAKENQSPSLGGGKGGKGKFGNGNSNSIVEKVGALGLVFDYFYENGLFPTSMSYYNVYAVDNYGNYRVDENFNDISVFEFSGGFDGVVRFTESDIVAMDTEGKYFSPRPRLNPFANEILGPDQMIFDKAISLELNRVDSAKVYGEYVDTTEALIDVMYEDYGTETNTGLGSGGYSEMCWPDFIYFIMPIIDWLLDLHSRGYWSYTPIEIGNQITSIRDDVNNGVYNAATIIGNHSYIGSPISASFTTLALDETDIAAGTTHIDSALAASSVQNVSDMNFDQMVLAFNN